MHMVTAQNEIGVFLLDEKDKSPLLSNSASPDGFCMSDPHSTAKTVVTEAFLVHIYI